DDGVGDFTGGNMRFDSIKKANELLMAMALHVAADDGPVEHIQRSEQCGGAVALVIMGHGSGAAFLHRQTRLRPVERLDLMGWMAPSRHNRAKVGHQNRSHSR